MANKRTQFLSRLLRISQLNEQLREIADKSIKQPAYAKRIKLVQMNPTNINFPDSKTQSNNPEKIHGKIMVISKHSNHLNQISSYRSETIIAEQEMKKSSISPVKMHDQQSRCLIERKRTSFNSQGKQSEQDGHFINSVTCEGRYQTRPEDIYRRRLDYKVDNSQQKRSHFEKRGGLSTKIINQQGISNAQGLYTAVRSIDNLDKIERSENNFESKVQRQPKYFKSFHHMNSVSIQKNVQEQKKAKLSLMKQINKNYAKQFIPPPKITAKSYIICETKDIDDNLRVVVSFNSKNSQQVASLTKIMTCILIIQFCEANSINYEEQQVKIGKYESNIGGTSADLKQGQIYTVKQLLYGLMLPSGNDASLALAVWCGKRHILIDRANLEIRQRQEYKRQLSTVCTQRIVKSQCYSRFIRQMNQKAQSLKMAKTHYVNSHGLINVNNRSTAYDIAVLSAYAMKKETFREIVSCKIFNCTIKCQEILPLPEELREEHEQVSNTEPDQNDIQQDQTIQADLNLNLKEIKPDKASRPATAKVESSRLYPPPTLKHSISKEFIAPSVLLKMDVYWQNTHKLLHSKPKQYLGIKTGITSNAGPCLSSCVTIEDRKFLIVVLNCARINLRFKETEILKKWLYKHEGLAKTVKKMTNLKFTRSIKSMNNQCEQSQEGEQGQQEDIGQD